MELDDELLDKLCNYVKLGINLDVAAMAEGVNAQTLGEWISKANNATEGIYSILLDRLNQARAQGEILHVQRIVADGGPKESQWILERLHPEKWAPQRDMKAKQKTAQIIDAAFNEKPKRKQINGR